MSKGNIDHSRVHEILLADIRARQARLRKELAELEAAEQAWQTTSNSVGGLRIEIPLPPERLWPNKAKGHGWAWGWRDKRDYRRSVRYSGIDAVRRGGLALTAPLARARLSVEVYWPKYQRRLDNDNLWAALKSAIDGLVDGCIIASDAPASLELGSISHHRLPMVSGKVILILENLK